MSDPLLPYYNRELSFLREMGEEFARANPHIASRLQLDADMVEDPHVSRMVEGFAYLNARTRHKLDDDFPELAEAMLGVLYPHYLAPVPSCAIVQFQFDRDQQDQDQGKRIKRHAMVETAAVQGQPVRFRTCYPVTVWPIRVRDASFAGIPFKVPSSPYTPHAVAAVQVSLHCPSSKVSFGQLPLSDLRFFLSGQSAHMFDLYEILLNHCLAIVVAGSAKDENPVVLGKDCLRGVGFDKDESLLEYPARSFVGYRLLTEFFAFSRKFLFLELTGLGGGKLSEFGDNLELFFLLDRHQEDLEVHVNADTFQLGCTPVVNLFPHRAEPVTVTHRQLEYRVVPDTRRPRSYEVYSVNRVTATEGNREMEFSPFYSIRHGSAHEPRRYWHAMRRAAGYRGGELDEGTDVFLTLVDLSMRPSLPSRSILDIETTCTNRDLPQRLATDQGKIAMQLAEESALVRVRCLVRPTPTLRPPTKHGNLWRLISHLSLNHLSLVDVDNGAEAIREILRLYDFADLEQTREMIEGVLSINGRRVVGRVGGHVAAGFCRGTEVTCHFDEQRFTGGGLFLFASVLERFFGLYTSINSFTQMVATTNQREKPVKKWPPRAGSRLLL